MCKNKILEKLLAIILIFTLTFANFAFTTECLATSLVETLFGGGASTGHENVEFEAYFGTEEEKFTSVISSVNTQDLSMSLTLGVKEAGYLKDGKIEILESEEGNGLNFKVKDETLFPECVQGFEENVVLLKQIDNSSETLKIDLPLVYENEDYVNENKLSKDVKVYFSGIYVDIEGEETEVEREIVLNVSWEDERQIKLESNVVKYIDFGKGIIVQTSVKLDSSVNNNSLPAKSSKLEINVPVFEDQAPSNVTVVANSTEGTNGKTAGNVNFDQNNWYYDQENKLLTITVENQKELVKVNENEDDYLKEADEEVIEEERYYSKSGKDEYLVTYTFDNVTMPEKAILTSKISAEYTTLSGDENDNFINVTTSENDIEYSLEGKTGDIVSLSLENETKEVSKAYMYSNYNHSEQYEVEYKSKTILNIAYKDIVEKTLIQDVENFYKDKEGNVIPTEDMYYKQISISKENFDQVLGQDGELKVLDIYGNIITVVNKDYSANEEGNLVINFENRISKVNIETTTPIAEGNLVINKTKAIKNASVDRETLRNISFVSTQEKVSAKYSYVEDLVEVQTVEKSTALLDTTTDAALVLDRDNLSTLAVNDNVELRIELGNSKESSDLYGHSVFEIELPEEVQSLEVTNANLVYGEGLTITSAEVIGRVIRITLDGVQEGINSGVLTNGTNIELNANIKVDLYAPAKTEKIKLRYSNDSATNYATNGYEEVDIAYSAPTGLVTVNSTSNYNLIGSVLTSVRQGSKEDVIEIYADAKAATMEVIVMNNNNNKVSNVAILGRIPFKGVKEISTGEDLGTTIDTRMLSGIASDERNQMTFNVYYSTNGEANKDLNDPSNGWTMTPETLDNVKSYLIVPVDSNYVMNETDILRFTYQYEIPGNLPHNEKIYGTFETYYTNHTEIATVDESSSPDKVGLTTGKGPELTIAMTTDRNLVREFEEIEATINVTNIGEESANDVVVNFPIVNNTKFKAIKCEKENITAEQVDGNIKISLGEVKVEEIVELKVYLTVKEISDSEEKVVALKSSVAAKDLGKAVESDEKIVEVEEAEFSLYQYPSDTKVEEGIQAVGTEIEVMIQVKNLMNQDKTNVIVTEQLPQCFEFVSAYVCSDKFERLENTATYDEGTRTITWNIDKVNANYSRSLAYTIRVADLPEGISKQETESVAQINTANDNYYSNALLITAGKAIISVVQTTTTTDTYIKEGTPVEYVFKVKNEGTIAARRITFVDNVPDGLVVRSIKSVANGIETNQQLSTTDKASVNLTIMPGQEATVTVRALAKGLKGVQEKTVTNQAVVKSDAIGEIETNSITHIIEADERKAVNEVEKSTSPTGNYASTSTSGNIVKTYKVTGTAWLDENENGMRELDEQLMSGVSAMLINSENGVITKTTTTDSNGTYTFAGVQNGKYLIIFDYDTVKYTVTAYQKADITPNVNSDAITTQIEQNGKIRNGAVTDVVNVTDGSVSNIDIGFVYADIFDLKLEKAITKVTVQTVKGINTDKYDKTTFAKTEIHSKQVSGATVYIEYVMTVTNVGDIAGYAKKIVDYLPEGMTFNSGLEANANWYTGTDGNLYNTTLAGTELASGQSAEIKLVLTKQMTAENTGIVNNLAEIYEDYNIYGVSDKNSVPANKAQGENDLGKADTIISIKTGEVFINISVIITTILLGSVVVFIAYNRIVLRKRKGGV